jgi:hypothetical protein
MSMTEPLTYAGIFVVVFLLFFAYSNYTTIRKISSLSLEAVSYAPPTQDVELAQQYGFEFKGAYEFVAGITRVTVFGYQQPGKSIYMSREVVRTKNVTISKIEFDTEFMHGYSLTTSASAQMGSQPFRPGTYGQSFPKQDHSTLWQKHLDAQNYLIKFGSVRLVSDPLPFKDTYETCIRNQANYIRSLFCWPLIGIYGFFIRRHFWNSKTIEQQHQKRMIKLPNEILI